MAAVSRALADAIVAGLNAQVFSLGFTAERSYAPQFDLPDLATLRVSVVPAEIDITTANRKEHNHDYDVQVGVEQKVKLSEDNDAVNAQVDPLTDLLEEMADYLRTSKPGHDTIASFQKAKVTLPYSPEVLREKSVFLGVITLTYRKIR